MGIERVSSDALRAIAAQSTPRTPPEGQARNVESAQLARQENRPESGAVRPATEQEKAPARQESKPILEQPDAPQRAGTRMRVDEKIDRVIAQILDRNREVIKQIPPEEQVKLLNKIRETHGLLFDELA
jgi:uncharacterized FlaG/YvyC family protein